TGAQELIAESCTVLRTDIGIQVVYGKLLARERRWLGGEGLRRPCLFARHIAAWHRAFLDWPQRRSGDAIEDPDEPLLTDLRHRIDRFAVMPELEQFGCGGIVIIPDIVMNHLEMPEPFAGPRVECEERIAEQVRARAVDAVEVVLRARSRQVYDPARL